MIFRGGNMTERQPTFYLRGGTIFGISFIDSELWQNIYFLILSLLFNKQIDLIIKQSHG